MPKASHSSPEYLRLHAIIYLDTHCVGLSVVIFLPTNNTPNITHLFLEKHKNSSTEFMADSVLADECLNNVGLHQRYMLLSHLIEPLQTMQSITWPGIDGSIPAAPPKKSEKRATNCCNWGDEKKNKCSGSMQGGAGTSIFPLGQCCPAYPECCFTLSL